MMDSVNWEMLLAGALVILVILWFRPGIKRSMEVSKQAPSDWGGLIVPLIFVVVFVIFLLAVV